MSKIELNNKQKINYIIFYFRKIEGVIITIDDVIELYDEEEVNMIIEQKFDLNDFLLKTNFKN